jgi:hypothetical protein
VSAWDAAPAQDPLDRLDEAIVDRVSDDDAGLVRDAAVGGPPEAGAADAGAPTQPGVERPRRTR